jgi:RND superfamily putative drug exporter
MFRSLADRIGARPRTTLLVTLFFVLLAGWFGATAAASLDDGGGFTTKDSASFRADERIAAATGRAPNAGVVLLLATPEGADSPAARTRVGELESQLAAEPGIAAAVSQVSTGSPSFVAEDGRSTFIAGTLDADADADAVSTAVLDRFGDQEGVTVGGSLIAETQIGEAVGADLGRAELFAFPILLVLSLLFFRGRATVIPLVVGIATVLGTFLALRLVDSVYGLSVFALNLVIGLGLGLAIDYSLFLVTRYREEIATSGAGPTALRRTMATAGKTVVFSAATVAAALATLTIFPLNFLQSMGIAGAVVAVMAAVWSLLVSGAFFALWGVKVAKRRRATPSRMQDGRWYRLSHAVMRKPGLVAVLTGLVMVVIALPSLRAEFTPVDSTVIPTSASSRTVADALQADYTRQDTSPVTVVVEASRTDSAAVTAYSRQIGTLPGVRAAGTPVALDDSTWRIDLEASGRPDGDAARGLVGDIRDVDSPFTVLVGGEAAAFVDQQNAIGARLPAALALLALLTFVILWLMTGSVVLPLKAIVMNVLTVGSSLGVLVLVFQDGRLQDTLGYTSNGGVEPTDFLVAAALVFALSTDYGVFLLGRIKEARDGTRSEREAVAVGLERTGAVVTAAAILLAVAIGAFITSSISFIQQIGIATAFGVLIDAFIVRSLLVPALMGLLGSWNWWSPPFLRRLHDRVGISETIDGTADIVLPPRAAQPVA